MPSSDQPAHTSKTVIFPPQLGLVFAILVTSTSAIFIRFAQRDMPSLVIAALRLSMASLILLPIALGRNRDELRHLTGRQMLFLVLSGFFLALHFATWISSLAYTSVASSVVLVTTSPLWVALLSPLVLREKLPRIVWLGLIIALAGSTVVGIGQGCQWTGSSLDCPAFSSFLAGKNFLGNGLALAGAWFVAGYLLIGRRLRAGLSLTSYIFVVYGSAAIFLLGMVLIARLPLVGYAPGAYFWCLMLALLPQLLGHSTYNWALRYLPAAYVSIAALGEPVVTIIASFFILKEIPTSPEWIGGVLILLGIYLSSRSDTKKMG
jgi:drug/metabolite transporter (DMT)-like permease